MIGACNRTLGPENGRLRTNKLRAWTLSRTRKGFQLRLIRGFEQLERTGTGVQEAPASPIISDARPSPAPYPLVRLQCLGENGVGGPCILTANSGRPHEADAPYSGYRCIRLSRIIPVYSAASRICGPSGISRARSTRESREARRSFAFSMFASFTGP